MQRESLKPFCLGIRQGRYYLLLLLFLSLSLSIHAQNFSVSGTISDETGVTIPGVSIIVKGTTLGTVSDIDGKFHISVPDGKAELIFSCLGFATQEISVNGRTTVNVKLKENTKLLEEVVVVGYAKVAKANLTGAVDQIKGDVLENRPVVTVAQALQGTMANLNISSSSGGAPGSGQSINIRGYTGFGTTTSPLVVIDGIQGGDIKDVNPDDIESISILKDAASAAIYGSSAPYGVIIITTKKGKKGAAPKITYNNNFGFAQPINLPKMMNSLDFANLYNEASLNAGSSKIFNDETIQRIKDYQAGIFKDETIKSPVAGQDSWYSWESGNANNNWFDIYYKDFSFAQQHNLGVSGGSENSTYYVGLGYNDKNGMYNFGDDKYERFNVRTNLSSTLTKWLSFNFMGAYSRSLSDSPNSYASRTGGNYMHQIARKWPTVPLKNPDGNYSETSDVLLQQGGRFKYVTDKAKLTGEFIATPLKGWDITLNYTFDGTFEDYSSHVATLYQVLPSGKNSPVSGTTPNGFSRYSFRDEHQVINAFTSYEIQLGDHYLKGLAGYTQELFDYTYFTGSNSYLYSDETPSLALSYGTTPSTTDALRQLSIRGAFGRINYGYKEKYLLELNARYDGTSRFLKDVRYRFYPGVSAAWVASKENFWESVRPYVNLFKLRLSYGSLGDQGFLDSGSSKVWYPFYPSLSTTRPTSTGWIFSGGREASVSYPPLINDQLTWITTTTYDIGVDFEFLKNRLAATFDVYLRKSDDHVGPAEALPAVLGASAPQANNTAMETRGFDLTVTWRDRISDFGYGIRAVLSDYQGKVTKYPNPTGALSTYRAGQKMREIWGYDTYGLFQTQAEIDGAPSQSLINANKWTVGDVRYVDRNGNGKIDYGTNTESDPGDRHVIGNGTPRFQYGLTLDADYKGFDFSIFFQGVAKCDAFIGSNYFWGINGDQWQSSLFTVHNDRWTPENPNGYFPKYYMSGQNSKNTQTQSRYLQDASYLRIKNLQLGYKLPESWVKKIKFDKVRIFATVENLATYTKLIKTVDPEFYTSDGKIYPLQRTWSGGINITF